MLLRTTPKTLRQAAHLDAVASEIRDPLSLDRAYAGRDPRGLGRRSGSARGGGRRRILIGLTSGTIARNSEIFVRTGTGSTGKWISTDEPAIVEIAAYVSGASGQAMLVTGAHTQELTDADDLTGAAWTDDASTTVTADQDTAPDGTTTADGVDFAAVSAADVRNSISKESIADNTTVTLSAWARVASGTESFRLFIRAKDGTFGNSGDLTATTSWQRFDFSRSVGADATPIDPEFLIGNGTDGSARTLFYVLPNVTQSDYPVPTTRGATPSTLEATDWTLSSASQRVREGRWKMASLVTLFDVDSMASGDTFTLLSFGGANDTLVVEHDGTDVRVRSYVGGTEKAKGPVMSGGALTDHGELVVDADAGTISLGGSSGPAGTSWDWPDNTLRLGAVQGTGASPWDGLITAIERA